MVFSRVVDQHGRRRFRRLLVLEIGVEERDQHVLAEVAGGVALPLQRPQVFSRAVNLAMVPRPHDQVVVARHALGLQRLPGVDGAVHVLLVPQALQPHGRHVRRMRRDDLVQRLALPEGVIGRVRRQVVPETQLFEAVGLGPIAGRDGVEEVLIVVGAGPRHVLALAGLAGLAGEVVEVHLTEGAVVEPVVAHPAVDHRAFGGGDLQRRVRVEQRHGHGPAVVGRADHADLLVRFRHVLDQPVDRVPGIGGVVGLGRVQRPHRRPRHDVVALRAVLAADVLIDEDIAVIDPFAVGRPHGVAQVRLAVGDEGTVGIVRRAFHQHGQPLGALGHDDDGVQLHAVAHRDHHLALDVVPFAHGLFPLGGDVVGHRCNRRLGHGRQGGADDAGDQARSEKTVTGAHEILMRWGNRYPIH